MNIPLEYRLCNFCDDNVIEDKILFLLHCNFHTDSRNTLLLKAIEIQPNYNILNIDRKLFRSLKLVKDTAKYLFDTISRRRSTLYQLY